MRFIVESHSTLATLRDGLEYMRRVLQRTRRSRVVRMAQTDRASGEF